MAVSLSLILIYSPLNVFAQQTGLQIEINATQNIVHNDRAFEMGTSIRNTTKKEIVLQTHLCSYGEWIANNSSVHVGAWNATKIACKKNPIQYIKLKPGDVYQRALPVRIKLASKIITPQEVTFRLGLKPQLGFESAQLSSKFIWSNKITIKVDK